ncbi:MAG: hypothetical protein FJ128_06610 [Deltaproteobacteria bacterium]|nr:hypothetical protein [Deltaproteobacteria bacterium]
MKNTKEPPIPVTHDAVARVFKDNYSELAATPTFTTTQFYPLFKKQYPDHERIMEERKKFNPNRHGLEQHLNGFMWNYSQKADNSPAIQFLGKMTYRFLSN